MKKVSQKLVSIIVRTKNRPETLAYALQSIVKQSYSSIEIILVNDGDPLSKDISNLLNKIERPLKLINNKHSLGRCKAGNIGLSSCRGDYIIFLDDDDWFNKNHIKSLVQALATQPDYQVAYAGVRFTNNPKSGTIHVFNSAYDPVFLMLENTIPIHALLFSKQLLDSGCKLDESLSVFEDWDLWLQFAQFTSFYHVDAISAGYRTNGSSAAGWGMSPLEVDQHRHQLISKWQTRWSAEQLDKALHWHQTARNEQLALCQQQKGKVMQDHKTLHNAHQQLEKRLDEQLSAHQSLEKLHSKLINEHQILNHHYHNTQTQLHNTQAELQNILNSSIWRYTHRLRQLGTWLKVKKPLLMSSIQTLPGRLTHLYSSVLSSSKNNPSKHLNDAKVGLMLHLYYVDLFAEIYPYLNKIPIHYQLMISVTSEQDKQFIKAQQHLLNNNAQLIIKQVNNRGRDIAPLFVAFAQEIQALDIIGHIHSKKSHYAGNKDFGEQWLHYLLEKLLGSSQQIQSILCRLSDDQDIGIIYPETYPAIPYWAHTWLSNRSQGEQLLKRMGIRQYDFSQYIDYPAGSMFWAKTKALKPLYDLQLSLTDFPQESGQTDNTLHHAIERCLLLSSDKAGYQPLFIAAGKAAFKLLPYSDFVFRQYISLTPMQRILSSSQAARVISFDIFDTLLIRPFASPDAVFDYLAEKISRDFSFQDFKQKRQTAEHQLRCQLQPGSDVTISQIYQQIAHSHGLDKDTQKALMQLEISTELGLLQPRPQVAQAVLALKQQGKKLILVSDMYLEKEHLLALIDSHFKNTFSALYVSSDIGQRKDRGDIWQTIFIQESVSKEHFLHVGDNEHSDIQLPVDQKFLLPIHVMRPLAFLGNIAGGQAIIDIFRQQKNWPNELMLGLIANKVLNYYEQEHNQAAVFSHAENFGYSLMGPILFSFMSWLINHAIKDKTDSLLFLSRDGWLLEQLFNSIKSHHKITHSMPLADANYFYCSRSFIGLAAIDTLDDLSLLLAPHYNGSVQKLLKSRFGLNDLQAFIDHFGEDELLTQVSLPDDREKIEHYLRSIFPSIQEQAQSAKNLFTQYWQQTVSADHQHPAIVDIGYSGTLQKAMLKLLAIPLSGYYFVTNESAEQITTLGGHCQSCFGHLLAYDQMNELTIHRYSLLLEAILTSPEGQLDSFARKDDKIIPLFKKKGLSQLHFDTIDSIHKGIISFTNDMLDVIGDDLFKLQLDSEQLSELLSLVINKKIDIGELSQSLSVEDEFSGNGELSVLDFYH